VGADGLDAVGTDAVVAKEVGSDSDGSDAVKTDSISAEGVGSRQHHTVALYRFVYRCGCWSGRLNGCRLGNRQLRHRKRRWL
jgi:hypothetical protein